MRRGGRGGGGPGWGDGDVSADSALYALTNLSASNYYATSNTGGEPGNAGGWGFARLFRVTTQGGNATRVLGSRLPTTPSGCWDFNTLTGNTQIRTRMFNAAGAVISASLYTLPASDVGKLFLVVVQQGSGTLRTYVNRQQLASVACVGYQPGGVTSAVEYLVVLGVVVWLRSREHAGADEAARPSDERQRPPVS